MPIYEFYCEACNTLLNFFSATIDTEKKPDCPRCGKRELERRPARFATLTSRAEAEDADDELFGDLDEERLEAAMAGLESEFAGMDEENPDPRQMAQVMRKLGQATGLEMGPKMEEMIARLESGADPEALEEEMGDLDGDDDAVDDFFRLKKLAGMPQHRRPQVDDELYFF